MFFLKRIEAVFEVNTDLQKNVQAKITAHLTWPSVINSSQRIMFPLTNTNSSSVSRNNPPLVATCAQTHVGSIFTVLFKSSVFWNEVETSLCFSAGRGSDSAESCRRPRLCPSSPLSPVTKPICVYWKAGRPVRNLQRLQLFFFFSPPPSILLWQWSSLILFPRLPLGNLSNINIDTNTLEFQVHRNQVSAARVTFTIIQEFRESAGWHIIALQSSCSWRRQHVEAVCL